MKLEFLYLGLFLCAAGLPLCVVGGDEAPPAAAETGNDGPSFKVGDGADRLLAGVLSRLPRERLSIIGDIKVRRRRGIVVRELGFETVLEWGAEPSRAEYTIRDAFGRDLERLTVSREPGRLPKFRYQKGAPLVDATLPDLSAPIQGSDMSWQDITLAFLWWPGAKVVAIDEVRGRRCYVVEVHPADGRAGQYSRVRIWVDAKLYMLLQAEGYRDGDEPVRRLWVKSLKKINDRWMIKDLEIQGFPQVHRTKLTVRDVVEPGTRPDEAQKTAG